MAARMNIDTVAPHDPPPIDPDVYERRWRVLAVLCTSLVIVIIGNTALNVAIPRLALDLDASTTDLQWMVDSYALVFAGMLFTAGTIGDRFGRKGTLQGGLLLFLVGTLLASFGSSSATVIAARAVMGLGAAFVMPSTLSLLTNVFPRTERPRAIAVLGGHRGRGCCNRTGRLRVSARALLVGLGLPRERPGDHRCAGGRQGPASDLP